MGRSKRINVPIARWGTGKMNAPIGDSLNPEAIRVLPLLVRKEPEFIGLAGIDSD